MLRISSRVNSWPVPFKAEKLAQHIWVMRLFAQQKVHTGRSLSINLFHPWPPRVTARSSISLYLLIQLLGSTDQKTSSAGWGRGPPLSRALCHWGQEIWPICCFFSGPILFCKCAVATGQRSPSIRQALSLSTRYICTINKGEGLGPGLCFDFIIYILFILCPPTQNHFLPGWQDLYW